ncbi:MAG: DUF2914 domain-containing protein [Candidatus Eisenbacteria sp.]|nr:DUF2914 domain-containing protein [Candidatus Eisenbacteria bacterium]
MIHRMLVLIVVACLLGACSGDEAASERNPSERSQTAVVTEPGETLARKDDVVPASSGEPVGIVDSDDTSADTARVESVEDADEPLEASTNSEEPAQDEPAGGPDQSAAPGLPASSSGLRVLRTYVCKGIEQSEPTEAGKSFIPEDGVLRLCCFSEIAGAAGPDTVLHIWRWGDREMARVVLEVKNSRWRTWSTKRILDEWRGEWHVDVTDSDGVVLTRLEFSVE